MTDMFVVEIERYHELVDQSFLRDLDPSEREEMERLGQQIDEANRPFYERLTADLERRCAWPGCGAPAGLHSFWNRARPTSIDNHSFVAPKEDTK